METENTVSIWIGNFDTKLELDEFITLKYDDEGEAIPSMFYHQYNIDIDDITFELLSLKDKDMGTMLTIKKD